MNITTPRPLPNATDKAALEAIAASLVQACPGLHDAAQQVARQLLQDQGLPEHDPDRVYFHRFKTAQSSTRSFTGWEHSLEKPYESTTLTQLVIHRFRATDQDNADLLDLYGGFYSEGPDAENFSERNEVRLHGSEVLKAFWSLDFSAHYRDELSSFWDSHADNFRTLAKCNFLIQAVQALEREYISHSDFQWLTGSVIGELSWPVTLNMLQTAHTTKGDVRAFDVDGSVATQLLRIVAPDGRQILYVPGDTEAFVVKATPSALHWWVLEQMNDATRRASFLNHFSLADRQQLTENLTDLMNRLVSTWGRADHHLINRKNLVLAGDAFTWLRDNTRLAMFAEADLTLTSNADLRKKLWIGYLSAGLKVFGPMAVVGWPVALPVIGATVASMGLNIDQAENGKSKAERKSGVLGAVVSGINLLFNLPLLAGTGPMLEVGAQVEAAEAAEMAEMSNALNTSGTTVEQAQIRAPEDLETPLPIVEQTSPAPAASGTLVPVPERYQCNELLDGTAPGEEAGKFAGIYRLDSDPPYAILMNDTPYYVRWFADSSGAGDWAIVDPARPNQLVHALPVRLNGEGLWERMPALGLKGGGQCVGKQCAPDIELDTLELVPPEVEAPAVELPQSSQLRPPRVVRSSYDIDPTVRRSLKAWAMNLEQTHVVMQPDGAGGIEIEDPFEAYAADKRQLLQSSAIKFFQNMPRTIEPERPALPDVSRLMPNAELIDQVYEAASGLVIGQTPDRIASLRWLMESMPSLARHAKTLYMRGLLSDFAQVELNRYFTSGEMSENLEEYLSSLGSDPEGRFTPLELVRTAKANGIRVQAIDCAASYKMKTPLPPTDEQIIGTYLASDIMTGDALLNAPQKWIVLTDAQNTNAFRGMPGLSEIKRGIGLRIEEVGLGEDLGIEADPGTEVPQGTSTGGTVRQGGPDLLRADLRLRVPAQPVNWTEQSLENLLHRRGMYMFKKTGDSYTLVHRSKQGMIQRTPVTQLSGGRVSLHRPSWPRVNNIVFSSLKDLSNRLSETGLTLQSRLPD
ncbi:membrane-targeted effector domain-containing toxin [Pseudomonas hamedanensis]|uniref:Membrane-targeted effector domain-containing toxin n=1 Tax=Pseudomonas hamedanensis TaxID=2745504 RepID=A0A9E6NZJ9_9PSED|nr:membrane-targeted effector domain-containing toxin [Pseudomonas hamedanensis]QXI16855.1 membrane-targeted effector domain-containing toxin [Pseudomonas hamedanensis]